MTNFVYIPPNNAIFLAVQNSSIGDLVTNSLTEGHFDFDITE